MTVDRNDAPDGYEAREATCKAAFPCAGCDFYGRDNECHAPVLSCFPHRRADGQSVIFIKRRPHFTLTGGKRPAWLPDGVRFRAMFRNKSGCNYETVEDVDWWARAGSPYDIIAVRVLP